MGVEHCIKYYQNMIPTLSKKAFQTTINMTHRVKHEDELQHKVHLRYRNIQSKDMTKVQDPIS